MNVANLSLGIAPREHSKAVTPLKPLGRSYSSTLVRFGESKQGPKPKKTEKQYVRRQIRIEKDQLTSWNNLVVRAKNLGMSMMDYLEFAMPYIKGVKPYKHVLDGVTVPLIGHHQGKPVTTKITALLGAEQIFDQWITQIAKAKDSIQIGMYDFDNIWVDGGRETDGAEGNPGWKQQQKILPLLIKKAREGVPVQMILDGSVLYEYDEYRVPIIPRRLNNAGMVDLLNKLKNGEPIQDPELAKRLGIEDLKPGTKLPIEVVTYPRELANIYHVKLLAVDGKYALLGGMNLSNHSAANWDACVAIEGPEVANIQAETFYPDWIMAKHYANPNVPVAMTRKQLPAIEPVSHPAIQVLNTKPREYEAIGYSGEESIGDFLKEKLASPDLKDFASEQFVWTHKTLKNQMIKLHQEGQAKIRVLHSAGVVDQFPYSRNSIYEMIKSGVPVRFYNEHDETQERLHAKWSVFNRNELMIGSANISAAALETNLDQGERPDYESVPEGQKYTRGNRDVALIVKSPELAKRFLEQFNVDWKYSLPIVSGQYEQTMNKPVYDAFERKVLKGLKEMEKA